jgi:hypothetical protein
MNMGNYMKPERRAIKRTGNRDPAFEVKEADVINAVAHWLAIHRIPHWRVNSGGLKDSHGRLVRFGAKGMADFYAIGPAPDGKSIWIECKRPRGGVVSAAQKEFLDCINRRGGIGIIVNSIESLEQQLKEAEVI